MKTYVKKNSTILMQRNLGSQIVAELRQYADLPTTGFLAGGAVENTIWGMVTGRDPVIRDLDIFHTEKAESLHSTTMPYRYVGVQLYQDEYVNVFLGRARDKAYSIVSTTRDGLINSINVRQIGGSSAIDNYAAILKGFDVNSCHVGIDLETNQLIVTHDFAEFLDTGQLKVTYPVTPYNTAIRLAKKYRDLGCYCDLDSEFNYLSQVPLVLSKYQEINDSAETPDYALYAPCFGENCRKQYLANQEILDRYFILEKYEKTFKTSEHQSGNLYTLKLRTATEDAAFSDCRDVNQIQRVHELISGRRSIVEKNKKILSLNGILKEFIMAVPKYADCDFHDKHLRRIDHFLSAHPTLAMTFFKMQLNVQEQISAIKTLERAAGKHGLFVYGLVEQKEELPESGISEEWIEALICDFRIKYPKALKEREDIVEFSKAGFVTELVSVEDLMNEGKLMRHCVGGYGEFLHKGGGCLFHINIEGEESTLQISKISKSSSDDFIDIKIIQHRGKSNVSPIKSHEALASQLVDHLRNKIYKGKRWPMADYF